MVIAVQPTEGMMTTLNQFELGELVNHYLKGMYPSEEICESCLEVHSLWESVILQDGRIFCKKCLTIHGQSVELPVLTVK